MNGDNSNDDINLGDVMKQLAPVRDMFAAIVVAERYTIEDVNGNVYEFRPVLPARRQIAAALELEKLVRTVQANGVPAMDASNGTRTLMNLLLQNMHDAAFVEHLDAVWTAIHPSIARASVHAALDAGAGAHEVSVLDLFGLEAIVEGLLPFFARFGTSLISMMGRATGAAAGGQTSSPTNRPPPSAS